MHSSLDSSAVYGAQLAGRIGHPSIAALLPLPRSAMRDISMCRHLIRTIWMLSGLVTRFSEAHCSSGIRYADGTNCQTAHCTTAACRLRGYVVQPVQISKDTERSHDRLQAASSHTTVHLHPWIHSAAAVQHLLPSCSTAADVAIVAVRCWPRHMTNQALSCRSQFACRALASAALH